jgi:hypothetical protein
LSPGVSRSNAAASRRLWISSLAGSNTAAASGLPPAAVRLARFDLPALLLDLPLLPAGFFDRAFLRVRLPHREPLQVVAVRLGGPPAWSCFHRGAITQLSCRHGASFASKTAPGGWRRYR